MKSGFFYGHDLSFWFSVRFHAGEDGVCIWFGFWSPASDTVGSKDTRKLRHETRHSCVTPRGSWPALFTPRFQNHAVIDQVCCWAPPYNIPRSCRHIVPQSRWLSSRSSHFIALCWGEEGVPLLCIVEEKAPASSGPVAHWMRRCWLSDPRGLKPSSFWRFESSLVRSALPKQICWHLLTVHDDFLAPRPHTWESSAKENAPKLDVLMYA